MKSNYTLPLIFMGLLLIMTSCSVQNIKMEVTEEVPPASLLTSLPSPSSGKAVLYGKIDQSDIQENDSIIFLSKNLSEGEENIPATLAFSYSNDPRAKQNDLGEFLFIDVEPGQYAIVFWSVGGIKVVQSETSSELFKLIDVNEGDIINIGTIDIP